MKLQKEEKLNMIKKFQIMGHPSSNPPKVLNTGCLEVQIALWTHSIVHLTEHFKIHKKDHHGRRGLIRLVNKRRNLLSYLKRNNFKRYKALITELNIRK